MSWASRLRRLCWLQLPLLLGAGSEWGCDFCDDELEMQEAQALLAVSGDEQGLLVDSTGDYVVLAVLAPVQVRSFAGVVYETAPFGEGVANFDDLSDFPFGGASAMGMGGLGGGGGALGELTGGAGPDSGAPPVERPPTRSGLDPLGCAHQANQLYDELVEVGLSPTVVCLEGQGVRTLRIVSASSEGSLGRSLGLVARTFDRVGDCRREDVHVGVRLEPATSSDFISSP